MPQLLYRTLISRFYLVRKMFVLCLCANKMFVTPLRRLRNSRKLQKKLKEDPDLIIGEKERKTYSLFKRKLAYISDIIYNIPFVKNHILTILFQNTYGRCKTSAILLCGHLKKWTRFLRNNRSNSTHGTIFHPRLFKSYIRLKAFAFVAFFQWELPLRKSTSLLTSFLSQ